MDISAMDARAMDARYAFTQDLAREAGLLAYDFYKRRSALAVESKGLQDVVSIADRAVEDLIRGRLAERFPEDAFLGEESGASDSLKDGRSIWVVDPIDGTACFLNGMPSWCVSIALVHEGAIELGAIYDPNVDELYAARRGGGTYLNGERQPVLSATTFADGAFGIGFSHRSPSGDIVPFLQGMVDDGGMFLRNGSGALMLAYVSVGRLIGYFEPHINSWDCLAGLLLVQESGGWTSDFLADDGLLRGNACAAAASGLAPRLQALIAETVPNPTRP